MTEPKLSLHRKLAQVMFEVARIPKNGKAPKEMGGYEFVQVGDAADVIRKALAEQVLTMMPIEVRVVGQADRPTKSGGSMTTVDLIVKWQITDGDSGESITLESFGAGSDGGDKYSGKASTSAMKYALLTGFLLSTGEDSELATHDPIAAPRREAEPDRPPATPEEAAPTFNPDGGLIGTVAIANGWLEDAQVRATPEGPVIGFRLKSGRASQKVQAHGPMAVALGSLGADLIGQTVTCWGQLVGQEFTPKGTDRPVPYQVLRLDRIHGSLFDIPAVPSEAETAAMFDDAEQDRIDAAVAAAMP